MESAQILIPALRGLCMTVCKPGDKDVLTDFEMRHCFMPGVQPLLTAEGLGGFFEKKGAEKIYAVLDGLGIHCVCVKIEEDWIILGPFVVSAWRECDARRTLTRCGSRNGSLLLFKNYWCSLPIMSVEYAIRIAALLLTSTVGNPPREVEYVDMGAENLGDIPPKIAESWEELSVVQHRYQLEEQLMEAVTHGHTAEALGVYTNLYASTRGLRFMSDDIRDQIAGAAIIRTLVRCAALNAGLAPVLVDALSQEYAQKMHSAADREDLMVLTKQYITAFCAAVREYNQKGESSQVRRAIQYIQVHLSETVTVDELSSAVGASRQHFVRLFKAETGLTVSQYIAKARCECASELLENSRLHIHDIAYYVGYEDTNYFSRVFKNVMGMSPQEYREKKYFL